MLDGNWVILPTIPVAVWIVVRGYRRGIAPRTAALQTIGLVHFAAVVAVAFFPLPYQAELIQSRHAPQEVHVSLAPLWSLINSVATGSTPSVVRQSIGNFLMLMPLGVYLPLLLPRARRMAIVVLIGFAISVAIELAQLAISILLGYPYKITDVDDVILNSAGVAVGFGVYWIASHRFPALVDTPAQGRR